MSNFSKKLHKAFESWICGFRFDRYVAVSDYTKEALIDAGVDASRVTRIYNGISYNHFPRHKGADEPHFRFLYYGRVGYAKGVDLLLQAYHDLLKERDDHRLLMVIPSEEQPTTEPVERMIDELGLKVDFRHDLSYADLIEQIAEVDAVVIPSYSEGFCFAAAETVAIGTPIVTSGQGALSEVVTGKHIMAKEFTREGLLHAMSDALADEWDETPIRKFELTDSLAAYISLYDTLS